jgi:hypothetical protein
MPGFEDSSRIPLRAEGPLRPFYSVFAVFLRVKTTNLTRTYVFPSKSESTRQKIL